MSDDVNPMAPNTEPSLEIDSQALDTASKLVTLIEPLVRAHHCELVDLEYRRETSGWVLRVFVEKAGHDPKNAVGGFSLDDCVTISRDISTTLDVHDVVPHAFNLEVSSPGLERPLHRVKDYERYVGLVAKVHLKQGFEPFEKRRGYQGQILGVHLSPENHALIALLDEDVGEVQIPFSLIQKAQTVYVPDKQEKPGKKKNKKNSGLKSHKESDTKKA